jgi:hypothetical protein
MEAAVFAAAGAAIPTVVAVAVVAAVRGWNQNTTGTDRKVQCL